MLISEGDRNYRRYCLPLDFLGIEGRSVRCRVTSQSAGANKVSEFEETVLTLISPRQACLTWRILWNVRFFERREGYTRINW